MDNLYCNGNEEDLTTCRFDGWGQSDCDSTEAAGVICDEGDLEEAQQEEQKKVQRTPVM